MIRLFFIKSIAYIGSSLLQTGQGHARLIGYGDLEQSVQYIEKCAHSVVSAVTVFTVTAWIDATRRHGVFTCAHQLTNSRQLNLPHEARKQVD